jgi:protein involved in temperature-dependent protein secretion
MFERKKVKWSDTLSTNGDMNTPVSCLQSLTNLPCLITQSVSFFKQNVQNIWLRVATFQRELTPRVFQTNLQFEMKKIISTKLIQAF